MISVKKLRIIYCSTITTMYIQLDRIFVGLEKNAEELRKQEREGIFANEIVAICRENHARREAASAIKSAVIDTHSYSYSTVYYSNTR